MTVTAPIRNPAPAPPELDEALSHERDDAVLRETDPSRSASTASPTQQPAEALIKEARRRAWRRRLAIGTVAAAAAVLAGVAATASLNGAAPPSEGAAADSAAVASSLGVFEPARGRIVYPAEGELRALDPDDPTSVDVLAVPPGLGTALTPAAWSDDGTRLALSSEHSGKRYVMNAGGSVRPVPNSGGCCWFVTDPWLSPDGEVALEVIGNEGDRLRLNDVAGARPARVVGLDPPVGDRDTGVVPVTAWSPDGDRIAYTAYQQVGTDLMPAVYSVDLDTGDTRQLVPFGFGHIRQMAWSPDGSRLLVIAGPWRQANPESSLNPLTGSKETGLYLVRTDGLPSSESATTLHPIASGHYLAATWSPDSAQIAAIEYAPSGRRLVVLNDDGSEPRVLTDLPATDLFTGLAWHPGARGD